MDQVKEIESLALALQKAREDLVQYKNAFEKSDALLWESRKEVTALKQAISDGLDLIKYYIERG